MNITPVGQLEEVSRIYQQGRVQVAAPWMGTNKESVNRLSLLLFLGQASF